MIPESLLITIIMGCITLIDKILLYTNFYSKAGQLLMRKRKKLQASLMTVDLIDYDKLKALEAELEADLEHQMTFDIEHDFKWSFKARNI